MDPLPALTPDATGLTRRDLVRTGITGAATISLGSLAFDSVAAAATQPNPELLRSTYLSLSSAAFTAQTSGGTVPLTLVAVEDLAAAAQVPALRESDNAFSVRFLGNGLPSGELPTLSHPEIGEFPLFISPVNPSHSDGSQEYEAVVDSVIKRVALEPSGAPEPVDPGPRAVDPAPASVTSKPRPATLIRAALRRSSGRQAVIAALAFGSDPAITTARAVLRRNGQAVARTTGVVSGGQARLRFAPRARRLRAGRYELAIAAVDASNRVTKIRVPLRLR